MKKSIVTVLFLLGLIVGGTAFAERDTDVCSQEKGEGLGLCIAYCVAMDCTGDERQASEKACKEVKKRYTELTGSDELTCEGPLCSQKCNDERDAEIAECKDKLNPADCADNDSLCRNRKERLQSLCKLRVEFKNKKCLFNCDKKSYICAANCSRDRDVMQAQCTIEYNPSLCDGDLECENEQHQGLKNCTRDTETVYSQCVAECPL